VVLRTHFRPLVGHHGVIQLPSGGSSSPRWLAATPQPESETASRRLLLARDHRMERQPLRLRPRASHPAVTRRACRGGDRPFAHWPGYYTFAISRTSKRCLPLHSCTLMSHIVRGRLHGDLLDPLGDEVLGQLGDRAAAGGHVPHLADSPAGPAAHPHDTLPKSLATSIGHTRSDTSSCSVSGISSGSCFNSLVLQ